LEGDGRRQEITPAFSEYLSEVSEFTSLLLGYTTEGIITLVITLVTCGVGHIIGLIEGIIYLTKSDEEFVRTYIQNKKGWF
jgi:hypothetical protein